MENSGTWVDNRPGRSWWADDLQMCLSTAADTTATHTHAHTHTHTHTGKEAGEGEGRGKADRGKDTKQVFTRSIGACWHRQCPWHSSVWHVQMKASDYSSRWWLDCHFFEKGYLEEDENKYLLIVRVEETQEHTGSVLTIETFLLLISVFEVAIQLQMWPFLQLTLTLVISFGFHLLWMWYNNFQ